MPFAQKEISRTVAQLLLDCKAIKLNPESPFIWASGWKSPIYCDNRMTLSFPNVRNYIKNQLTSLVINHFTEVEAIAGVATAGIPQAALVADEIGLPFLYVRPEPKGHGLHNQIEGLVTPGQKIVLIEDLISTGGSSIKAANALKSAGFEVLGLVSVFNYEFLLSKENFMNANLEVRYLCGFETLLNVAISKGQMSEKQLPWLEKWRMSPATWG